MHEVRDRPFPIRGGSSGQSKRFDVSPANMSASNDVANQSNSDNVDYGTADGFEHQSQQLSFNQSAGDDRPRKKARSKKKTRSIEKKLLATKLKAVFNQPSSALIPLSEKMEEPAWQFSSEQLA